MNEGDTRKLKVATLNLTNLHEPLEGICGVDKGVLHEFKIIPIRIQEEIKGIITRVNFYVYYDRSEIIGYSDIEDEWRIHLNPNFEEKFPKRLERLFRNGRILEQKEQDLLYFVYLVTSDPKYISYIQLLLKQEIK